jgi:hypothetical protein
VSLLGGISQWLYSQQGSAGLQVMKLYIFLAKLRVLPLPRVTYALCIKIFYMGKSFLSIVLHISSLKSRNIFCENLISAGPGL